MLRSFLSCFGRSCRAVDTDDLDRNIYNVTQNYKISILPITQMFDIDNLYPLTDHVELWNIFIIGNDKTYILASINDPHINCIDGKSFANKQGGSVLPRELLEVFDSLWSKTLSGRQLQFYMVWNAKLFFVNTYPFFNGKGKVIGAIMFMRAFETMPETRFVTLTDGDLRPMRYSEDDKASPKQLTGAQAAARAAKLLRQSTQATHAPPPLSHTPSQSTE